MIDQDKNISIEMRHLIEMGYIKQSSFINLVVFSIRK